MNLRKMGNKDKRNTKIITWRKLFAMLMASILFMGGVMTWPIETYEVFANPDVATPSYILMEASTGQVICEQNADERRSPASITKIMTLLIIFEQLEKGKIHLDDVVTTSAYAKSMGGSQVFLEEGETQTLDTLIKCIAVASGNDASVAVAEFVCGSETGFVELMNQKAENIGLINTHFEDCCGLSNSDTHYTSARDVAILSKELLTKYPEILNYTGIWMEDIMHETNRGSSVFTLSSTNKLLKMYPYATGLKTGSTDKALYCLSATARKDDMDLIAVVMGAPSNKARFQDAMTLLGYGYNVCQLYEDKTPINLPQMKVEGGVYDTVNVACDGMFRYVDIEGNDLNKISRRLNLLEKVEAPVEEGQAVGEVLYELEGQRIGSCSIIATRFVAQAKYKDCIRKIVFILINTDGKRFLRMN